MTVKGEREKGLNRHGIDMQSNTIGVCEREKATTRMTTRLSV